MTDYDVASDSVGKKNAALRLANIVGPGKEAQAAVLSKVMGMNIIDKLVAPGAFSFHPTPVDRLRLNYAGMSGDRITIHPNALGQVASIVGIPMTYVGRLRVPYTVEMSSDDAWRIELLCHNFNTLLHKESYRDRKRNPAKHLHRFVGKELRGFLTRSYNRKLSNRNLLRPFVETCQAFEAVPIGATATDVRVSLKYVLPYIFEPVDGEFVAFGVTYANSDFGKGRQRVSGTCLRISSGTVSVLEDALCRVHLGSVIQESDIELSEETEDLELETHQSAVRDTVKEVLSPKAVQSAVATIQKAHEQEIPWYKLKSALAKILQKSEVEDIHKLLEAEEDVIDLPPVHTRGTATAWWASAVVGHFADKQMDGERKLDLQALAGSFLK